MAKKPGPSKALALQIEAAAKFFDYLYGRWQDEKEYEDFEEYRKAMAQKLPPGSEVLAFTKAPFRIVYRHEGLDRYIAVRGKHVEWGRIGGIGNVPG